MPGTAGRGISFPARTLQLETYAEQKRPRPHWRLIAEPCCTETQGLFPANLIVWTASIGRELGEGGTLRSK